MRGAAVLALATAALALAGCGFTPLYAQPGVATGLSRIAVSTPDTRLGFRLREQLEDNFGRSPGAAPLWRLATEVEQSRRPLGRRIDDTAVRYELTVRAAWTLTPVDGGLPITGAETATTTYAAADQPYAAIAAQQDGEDRAAAELARLIRVDITRSLADRARP